MPKKVLTNCEVEENAKLCDFTTFQLGGPCKALIHCQNPDDLKETVSQMQNDNQEFVLIGGGSNIVVSDSGIDAFVIRYLSEVPLIEQKQTQIIVSGSTLLDDLVVTACESGLGGINYLSGIPGTVGGAVCGNAGAFGKQICDSIESLEILTPEGEIKQIGVDDINPSYRNTSLRETQDIVLSVTVRLNEASKDDLQKERDEILDLRKEKHPDLQVVPSAGSFFRNVEPTSSADRRQSAGWFLEDAGAKDLRVGGAKVFEKHANIVVKESDGTSEDVRALSLAMQKLVFEKHNLELIREVKFIGTLSGKPEHSPIIW